MAFSYWSTGNFGGGSFRAPANQGDQGALNNAGFDGYGYANYVPGCFGKDGWNKGSSLRTDTSSAAAAVTWNPLDKYSNVTLSNGNKTATGLNGVGAAQCCRATTAQTSGKWYYEVRVDTLVANLAIGFDNGTTGVSAFTNPGQNDSKGIVYVGTVIFFGSNGAGPPTVAAAAAGDVVGVAVDAGTGQVWFAKNNVWTSGDPTLATGGYASGISTFYPFIGPYQADAGTGRWAAADQTYAVPSGFSAWDSAASSDVTLALTGQTVTAAQGTLTAAPSVALAGQAITASRGTLSPSFSFALTGSGVAASKGALAPAFSITLPGQSLIAARGTTLPSSSVELLGAGVVAAQGIVSVTGDVGPWTISALPTGAWSIESNPTSIWTISPLPSNRLA